MKTIFTFSCVFALSTSLPVTAQEEIPDAAPIDEPLKAEPERDAFDVAETLFAQAQSAETKKNPEEYKQLLDLCQSQFLGFVRQYPGSARAPLAEYRAAECLMELGRKNEAKEVWTHLVTSAHDPKFVASAAYRLASLYSGEGNREEAVRFYHTVVTRTDQLELKVDAQYRLGRLYREMNKLNEASTMFVSIIGNPQADPRFVLAARMGQASVCEKLGRLGEALREYKEVLKDSKVDAVNKRVALLGAGEVALKLKKTDEAKEMFHQLLKNGAAKELQSYDRLRLLDGLYHLGKYKEMASLYDVYKKTDFDDKSAQFQLYFLMGSACYQQHEYSRAAEYFTEAEKCVPQTKSAMKASYYRLCCYNELKQKDIAQRVQNFLNHYATAYPTSEYLDFARLLAAENLLDSDPMSAAKFYAAIDFSKLAPQQRPRVMFKAAWAFSAAGNRDAAAELLTQFITNFPADPQICEALILRGDVNSKQNKEAEALIDFDAVIKRWPEKKETAGAWERAAQIYYKRQDLQNMAKYYNGLVKNFPNSSPAVLALAHFRLGLADFDADRFEQSILHMSEAKTLDPKKYGEQVNIRTVLSYYKLQNALKLKESLETLQEENPGALSGIPEVIPAWLGLHAYGNQDLETADKYLTMATQDDKSPNARKVVWRNLAKVRLALKKYDRALVASRHFLEQEDADQPYRRADGMLDQAMILLGLGKYAEAKEVAEQALALGVEGPLMANLRLVLGDIAFAEKKYDEAATLYGVTAELFVNDKELKPKAYFKTAEALEKAGRKAEASQYRARLQQEFPDWKSTDSGLQSPDQ